MTHAQTAHKPRTRRAHGYCMHLATACTSQLHAPENGYNPRRARLSAVRVCAHKVRASCAGRDCIKTCLHRNISSLSTESWRRRLVAKHFDDLTAMQQTMLLGDIGDVFDKYGLSPSGAVAALLESMAIVREAIAEQRDPGLDARGGLVH